MPTDAENLVPIYPIIFLGKPHLRDYIEGGVVGSTTRTISDE